MSKVVGNTLTWIDTDLVFPTCYAQSYGFPQQYEGDTRFIRGYMETSQRGKRSSISQWNTLQRCSSVSIVTFCCSVSIRDIVSFESFQRRAQSRRLLSPFFSLINLASLLRNCLILETLINYLSHMRDIIKKFLVPYEI